MTVPADRTALEAEAPGDDEGLTPGHDADAFRLRGEPPRVMRLSRKTMHRNRRGAAHRFAAKGSEDA